MHSKIEKIVNAYWEKEITREKLIVEYESILKKKGTSQQVFYESIIINRDADIIEYLMTIGYALENDRYFIDFVHKLISEPWHQSYEEIAHYLQSKKKPESIEYIKNAIQKRYNYLESYGTGTRQFINQCGHALWSIGNDKAIDVIRELSKSKDPIIKDEMLYRISRIEGRNDYERDYDLE